MAIDAWHHREMADRLESSVGLGVGLNGLSDRFTFKLMKQNSHP
jgi:hypothetical protein